MRFYQYILKNVLQCKARSALTMIGVGIAVTAGVALVGVADGFAHSFGWGNRHPSRSGDRRAWRRGRQNSSLPATSANDQAFPRRIVSAGSHSSRR
jgi:hypothetical protein